MVDGAAESPEVCRRNSRIVFVRNVERPYVRKSYHAKYSAIDEAARYGDIAAVAQKHCGIRAADVLGVDEENNSILVEYVQGATLAERIAAHGIEPLMEYRSRVTAFLIDARRHDLHIDSDPSNFICDAQDNTLVIIDPICEGMNLQDMSMVVFLVGLMKCFVKTHQFGRFSAWKGVWLSYYREYLQVSGTSSRDLNAQISQYLQRVVFWNIMESDTEGLPKRLCRLFTLVPAWLAISLLFRVNIVKP